MILVGFTVPPGRLWALLTVLIQSIAELHASLLGSVLGVHVKEVVEHCRWHVVSKKRRA